MSLNANQKGKRFELRIAKDLAKKFDSNIRRTPNSLSIKIRHLNNFCKYYLNTVGQM